jgi:protein-S-isoprenylcysteine O-methyltransferase Ste14
MKNVFRQLPSLILPVFVLIIIPLLIEPNIILTIHIISIIGLIIVLIGLIAMILTIRMFVQMGEGTLAPWRPTKKLVVSGLYRYVRNPMILGVLLVLWGESILFRSYRIAIWLVVFFIINHAYFLLSEEPGLIKRFGREYVEYKKNVPRWIPRLKPRYPQDKKEE